MRANAVAVQRAKNARSMTASKQRSRNVDFLTELSLIGPTRLKTNARLGMDRSNRPKS